MDLFPTVLSAMGFEIEGDRLGLGTDLFSDRDTLLERRGFQWLERELGKASDYYVERFAGGVQALPETQQQKRNRSEAGVS